MIKIYAVIFLCMFSCSAFGQDSSLLKGWNDSLSTSGALNLVRSTFKATQIINTLTIEAPAKKGLQFLIMHRFGRLNEGAYALFGLDNASIRFGLDYGVNDRLSIGVGRSSLDKTYDGNFKWKLLRQKQRGAPLSVSLYELITHTTLRYSDKPYLTGRYRTAYQSSLLIARKFTPALSLQLTPSWIHFNLVPTAKDKNEVFALGFGGRMKLTKRMSFNAEYNYLLPDQVVSTKVYNALSFGFDLETGGHVFQLIFSNSEGMTGPYYLAKTTGDWGKGDIFFGFNISRAFNLKKER